MTLTRPIPDEAARWIMEPDFVPVASGDSDLLQYLAAAVLLLLGYWLRVLHAARKHERARDRALADRIAREFPLGVQPHPREMRRRLRDA